MKSNKALVSFVAVALLSTGCGGGSGDSAKTVRLNGTKPLTVEESSNISVNTGYAVKSIKPINDNDRFTLTFDGEELVVSSTELQSPALAVYDVYMASGKDTLIQRYELVGLNISALSYEQRAYSIQENYDELLSLSEDQKIYTFLVDLAYLREVISPVERDERIKAFDASESASYSTVRSDLDSLLSIFDQYVAGTVGESELVAYVEQAEASIETHGTYGLDRLRVVKGISSDVMDPLPSLRLVFNDRQQRFTRYFDSAITGLDQETGEVSYLSGYQILTPLMSN